MDPGSGYGELSIIAMKGYPFTRKTEFAETIASSLCCPIISLEDVLRCLTPSLSQEQEKEAFKIICEIALHHLRRGISKNVVIDSPLSSQSHLNHLRSLASRLVRLVLMHVRIVIIECKPMNNYSWKMKFEDRRTNNKKWYNSKNWEDVEKVIQDNPDYDVDTSEFVSKLVVDPLVDCPVQTTGFIARLSGKSPASLNPDLIEVVKYMMRRDKGDGPDVVVYSEWLRQSKRHSSSSITPHEEEHCRRHGHDIVPYSSVVKHEAVDCMACQKRCNVDVYCYCKNCSLALHMECAQAFNNDHEERKDGYNFNEESLEKMFACNSCMGSGKNASYRCKTCLFESHLRSRLYPTVIKHFDTEEHFLTVLLKSNQYRISESYPCVACGERDGTCMYFCKDHGVAYCYECVTLPRRVEDEHGGYHHILSLKFTSEEAEDYICQECLELRDPTLWFYSCEDCPAYDLHPHCIEKIRQLHPSFRRRHDAKYCKTPGENNTAC